MSHIEYSVDSFLPVTLCNECLSKNDIKFLGEQFALQPHPTNYRTPAESIQVMSGSRGSNNRGRGGHNRPPLPRDVQVSKKLSKLLRHDAEKEKLSLDSRGFANVQDVLNNRNFRSLKVTFEELKQIVLENDKQRFTLTPVTSGSSNGEQGEGEAVVTLTAANGQNLFSSSNPKDFLIRANQGHSLKIESEGLLTPITAENVPPTAVHGTTHANWPLILSTGGLKPMGRTHVHFASGLPAGFKSVVEQDATAVAAPVISGMRNSSTVLIYLDVEKAMQAGMKFWTSDNGVVLTEGNADGLVPVEFFKRVEDRRGEGVLIEDGRVVRDAPAHWGMKKRQGGR